MKETEYDNKSILVIMVHNKRDEKIVCLFILKRLLSFRKFYHISQKAAKKQHALFWSALIVLPVFLLSHFKSNALRN